ncbi:dmX-like protein 2 isoform X3 [Toxotes jaculatrix]|uniref:dmX-like protein 2 isoform X3 n=1 Tax=Toxotes jaculatrix TaxID=941984 RepID=UPI001B3AEBD7|nr:dmX-like protein 2 isoform X3 [Toxotes jaculatrix]
MHLHQVLTGAVNPGDCCYSVGSVNDIPFTAYGSGCDVVILASDFECVQIIPGAQNGNIQVGCVECSHQLGRIAASYGNTVCIFEPLSTNPNKRHKQLNYQWQKTGQFFLDAITYNLAWDPQGNRILAATERLQLWAPPLADALIEEEDGQMTEDKPHPVLNDWNCVWQCKTAASVHIAKWSPDGEYFATVGKDDCLLKVWYPTTGWRSAVVVQDPSDKKPLPVHFSFVYLAHPRSVTGMSWRKTSKYMPKGSVCNVLLTSCEDGVCRLWSETLLPEDSLLGGQISENTHSFSSSLPGLAGNKDKIQHALESIHHLKHLRRGRRRSSALVAHSELLPSQLGTQDAHTHRHIAHHANALCHFHISASINPNTDIPSVLADSAVFNPDDGTGGGGFVVHWLNNKDLSFTSSMDLFMLQLRKFSEQQLDQTTEDPLDPEGSPMKFDFDLDDMSDKASSELGEEGEPGEQGSTKASSPGSSSSMPLPSMLLERKMETLTTEWNKSPDMLFTIHPTDGSFLVWHVKYLDEFNQGIFRQVQVSFSSRIPVAFPTGDANSLSKNILMYACTLTEGESAGAGDQGRMVQRVSRSASVSAGLGSPALASSTNPRPGISPAVMMVSKHVDGSLNQWAVTFAERSAFSNVLTVSHKFRYCGHRFHLNDQACHTVLPLLLTSSHHNALLTPPSAPSSLEGEQPPTFPLPKGLPRKQLRNAATRTFHDPNAIYSELILWRVDHIGPLSCTGGVSELARINSLHTSAFSNVAWLPTLVPSSVLGTYCNSASACFVASDGKNLRLYQAVVDARKLLDELSDPETSKLVGEVFNIVSQQSTARPGCIIELDVITNQCGANTQLLHVFQEDFILGYKPHKEPEAYTPAFPAGEDYQPAPFSEKFFLVVIEKDLNRNSVLQMWHLHLKSVQACVDEPSPDYSFQSQLMVPNQVVNADSSPETSPIKPLPRSASTANLQSASKLILSSKLVYSKRLDLPHGVEVTRATPSAGHLSSSSIYPVCLAPYLIVTTCSDSRVRFWHCTVEGDDGYSENEHDNRAYRWEPWALMNEEEDNNSAVCVSGRPVAVSCSYIGRLAVAFKQPRQGQLQGSGEDFSMHVSIYECESTGGSEWVLEQTLHLDDFTRPSSTLDPRVSVDSNLFVYSRSDLYMSRDHSSPNIKHYVHLDWLSKEDGSHILTVGVGSNILMYGRISGMVNEQTSSKEGVAVITLPLGGSIKQGIRSRWILLRSVDLLSSVDGTPSLPVSLSWVRDGILVVGMDCEMHVYAQWHQDKKPGEGDEGSLSSADIAGGQTTNSSSVFEGRARSKSVFEGNVAVDEALRAPAGLQEGGLFEAAHSLSPTLPQYHPTQLLELMDLGKVRRAKAILAHLVKCIAGEVAVVRDVEAGEGGARRHLSRTISVTGSTAKDTIVAGRDGGRDYTEINSIPPLPLYALMLADLDTSYKGAEEASKGAKAADGEGAQKSTEDQYADLFQVPTVTTDDFVNFATDKPEKKSRVINLSQYGPTYFGPEHAQVLSSHLMHSSLPGLTRLEQMFLVALADTVATTSAEVTSSTDQQYTGGEALDECGLRYLLAMRLHTCLLTSLPPLYRMQLLHQGLSTCHFAWAFHSEAEEELLNMIPAMQRGDPQWSELRAVGVGWWIRNINTLRKMVEKLGKAAFQRHNDPLDAALFYLAMKKKAVLWGLFRSQHDEKMTQFFKNNFSEDRWRKAALKNAFSLLGKQRFEQSAAFFLLAGSLKDAIEVLMEKMEDLQLAMIVARLYEADFENSSTCQGLLYEKVLGCNRDGSGYHCSRLHPDPFLRSIAYWIMKDYTRALDTLLERIPKEDDENPDVMVKSCNPVVFSFYNYLRTHPLIIRRHFANSEATATTVGLTAEKSSADEINLIERKLFFTTANAHFKVGCPVLALEVLSKIPKVTKKSGSSPLSKASSKANLNSTQPLENGTQGGLDWGSPAAPAHAWGGNDSADGLDWSQPLVKVEEDELKLDWGDDKEDDEDEDEDDDGGLTMKKPEPETKVDGISESGGPKLQRADSQGESEVDVIAEQLKFRACLKILMTELRTLATGFEVDGGKLRFQLYNWLEKEIAGMHKICNYKVEGKEEDSEMERWGERTASVDISDEALEHTEAGAYERHQMERRRLQAKQQHSERRKAWLRKNQALLRVFLSYCSLHGAKGGGVTSVRMELLFLLQESQQETTVKQLQSPLPLPTTLPLLSACIAPTKTVIANPVLHLSNHIHDVLHTITFMEVPPHPDIMDDRVNALHTLAASLSACIYQALCDSHSYSTQTEANQFTGMVYQGLLLSERKRLRTESIEEHITPNSAPAQWPGVSSLISLLTSAREEDQPRLNVLLCEAVVAVYLSLLIHGLGTHSCNELFRLAAHPLNNRMWAAVFGGGAKVIVKPKRPEAPPVPADFEAARPEESQEETGRPEQSSLTLNPTPIPTETQRPKRPPPPLSRGEGLGTGAPATKASSTAGPSRDCSEAKAEQPSQTKSVSETKPVVPPQPPAEDVDRYRRRFNMRMLVPGRPVKETPANPPPVPTERPTYREKFIPPELSMWDYFVAKPFLPLSDSSALYDSDESGAEDDEDDDDAFLSDTQITEHSDPNSYSWALIRLVMVKLAHHNVKNFLPLTGLDSTDLPVTSPLSNAVLKTLENWEQLLLERMNKFDGPPPNYINTYPTDLSAGGGPAILRHKAMLEPDNTPFKTKNHQSFPARRLWHFLVKQEVLQETLIRYIFTKKRKQSESIENHMDRISPNCIAGASSPRKVEADLGYPGGKAKIIHKESDIIMAFSINKANSNEIVLASTHDVQEVDVSTLVAVQPFTWIGEDFDKESRSSDDIDHRSSHTNIAQASSVPFAPPQMPVSASMPWLGSGQTSMGASVIMKRNLNNVKRMTSHPIYQYYMTGAQDGSVRMFEWNRPQQLICFRQAGNARVTRLYFNSQGNKCGVADGEGFLSLWQVNQTSSNPKPYLSWQCHTKTCGDFAFITSSSLIATAGQSNDNRNVCLWDTLISPSNTMVHAFPCHENGATVLQYAPKQQLLITGGRKGFVCVFDIRQRQLLHTFQAHDSAIKALALDAFEDFFVTGSAEGNMKVWKLAGHGLMHSFSHEHAKQSIFRNIGAGVMQVETRPGNRIFTCGADGTLKMRVLPDRYNFPSSLVDVL